MSFKYDPFGRRIYKSSSSGTTIFAYDGDNRIEDLSSSGTATARYTQGLGIDEPLEVYEGGKSYYYHADGLGSIVAMTKSTGTAANTYFGYNTFGGMPAASETVPNPFRFTAREWDSETSLYYYRARYYDSLFGRFLSEDPVAFKADTNFYRYVRNNPVNDNDPTGNGFVDCVKALGDLQRATARVAGRSAAIVAHGGPDPGHAKALRQALTDLENALDKVKKHCGCVVAIAAEVAIAIEAAEAAIAAAEAALGGAAALAVAG